MCDSLLVLCNFVETIGTGSRSDVIRVACTRCDKLEVCPAVTEREFEGHKSTREGNEPETKASD